jgi:hypothetical protein
MMINAILQNSEGVICTPPSANHRCAVPVESVEPIPGIRTSTRASSEPT